MKHYVYIYIDPFTYKIFYVGKGSGTRYKSHLNKSNLLKNSHKNNKINKIIRNGGKPIIKFIKENLYHEEALKLEIKVIAEIGLENLTNVTPG